jgi:hypothetical protein
LRKDRKERNMKVSESAFAMSYEDIRTSLTVIAAEREWGDCAGTKSLEELISEVEKGESFVAKVEGLGIVRVIMSVRVKVLHQDLILWELFRKKEGKISSRYLNSSLGEKMFVDEKPKDAALRGLLEELGVTVDRNDLSATVVDPKREVKDSGSFPGLKTVYYFYPFAVTFDSRAYKSEYITEENGRKTCFVWIPVESWIKIQELIS